MPSGGLCRGDTERLTMGVDARIVFNLKKYKTMKEVYLLVTHAVCAFVDDGVRTQVFSTYDKAKEAFDAYVSCEMEYIAKYEGWIVEVEENRFEAWEDGRYCENHTFGEIRKVVVE